MIEFEVQSLYQDRKWTSIWFWKIFIIEEIIKKQHQQSFNNRKSKIENKILKIENYCSEFNNGQSTT